MWLQRTSDDTIQAELCRRQAASRREYGGSLNCLELHHAFMNSKGVSWAQLRAPPSTAKSAWFQLCSQREKEIIAVAMKYKPRLSSVDCSQRIDRASMEDSGFLPTITPGAKNFLAHFPGMGTRPLNRFMLGVESLAFQGFPVELLAGSAANTSDPQYQDLAGNAFASTCLLAVMLALIQCHDDSDATTMTSWTC